jgi:hypothetical protein
VAGRLEVEDGAKAKGLLKGDSLQNLLKVMGLMLITLLSLGS